MNKRTAFAAAAVAAVITVTGGTAAVVNLGLLESRATESAGQMSPVDATANVAKHAKRKPKMVVVKAKSKPREVRTVQVQQAGAVGVPVSATTVRAPRTGAPASLPAATSDDVYAEFEDEEEFEHEDEADEPGEPGEDAEDVEEAEDAEDAEDGEHEEEEELEGSDDDD